MHNLFSRARTVAFTRLIICFNLNLWLFKVSHHNYRLGRTMRHANTHVDGTSRLPTSSSMMIRWRTTCCPFFRYIHTVCRNKRENLSGCMRKLQTQKSFTDNIPLPCLSCTYKTLFVSQLFMTTSFASTLSLLLDRLPHHCTFQNAYLVATDVVYCRIRPKWCGQRKCQTKDTFF